LRVINHDTKVFLGLTPSAFLALLRISSFFNYFCCGLSFREKADSILLTWNKLSKKEIKEHRKVDQLKKNLLCCSQPPENNTKHFTSILIAAEL
jgi:hypothetical protein